MLKPGEATPVASTVPSVLFLDVDGVLNTSTMAGGSTVHPKLMRRLASVVTRTKCGLVLSSTWRFDEQYYRVLLDELDKVGVESKMVVGSTPAVEPKRCLRQDGTYGAVEGAVELQRCQEIVSWLDQHFGQQGGPRWAVLDDLNLVGVLSESSEEDLAKRIEGHLVKTNCEAGLTERNVGQVAEILGENT